MSYADENNRNSNNGGSARNGAARSSHQNALAQNRQDAYRSGNGAARTSSSGSTSGTRNSSGAGSSSGSSKKTEKKYVIRRIVFAAIVLLIFVLLIVGIAKLIKSISSPKKKTEAPLMTEVRFEAGDVGPAAEQLLTDSGRTAVAEGAFVRYETDITQINFHVLGNYKINVLFTDAQGAESKYSVTVRVVDTVPPEGVARDQVTAKGVALDVGAFIVPGSVVDQTDVAVSLLKEPDYNKVGVQTVDILLEDRGGNQTRLTASLTVTEDDAE